MALLIISSIFLLSFRLYLSFNNKRRQEQYDVIVNSIEGEVIFSLSQVQCSSFVCGSRDENYLFKHCDLYVTEDAVIIFGYSKNSITKRLSVPIILTNFQSLYSKRVPFAKVITPKKFNTESFNKEVYIEFSEPGLLAPINVEIMLKNISKTERDQLKDVMYSN